MGTFRTRLIWRGGSLVLWALLATSAALEEYDDVPDLEEASYQNNLNLNRVLEIPGHKEEHSDNQLIKDLLLYRLFGSLRHMEQAQSKYRRHWWPNFQESNHIEQHSDVSEKDIVVKRISEAVRGKGTMNSKGMDKMYRPQQKWKIKKGKALGSQMVCYFKLCAFWSPL